MSQHITQKEYRASTGKDKRFVVGIDAGVSSGLCIFDRECQMFTKLATTDFHEVYALAEKLDKDKFLIVIENPDSARAMYTRTDKYDGGRYREKMAANIGSNRREATLLIERFEACGFAVQKVTPKGGKWSAEQLKQHTGIATRTSQHVRDAVKVASQFI